MVARERDSGFIWVDVAVGASAAFVADTKVGE